MTQNASDLTEDEVLREFSAEPLHDKRVLEHYVLRYPEHAAALVDFALELSLPDSDDTMVDGDPSRIDKAWQRFKRATASAGEPSNVQAIPVDPFGNLSPKEFNDLAGRLQVSRFFLSQSRDRTIDASTMPSEWLERLATETGNDVTSILAYQRQPPAVGMSQQFKASQKPAATRVQSFEDAIESSDLNEEQRRALRGLRK